MKRAIAVWLSLMMVAGWAFAGAESYTISQLETDLTLPEGMSVFRDNSGEEAVDILFSLNNRKDVAYEFALTFVEDCEGYYTGTLPEKEVSSLFGYYSQLISGGMTAFERIPFFPENGEELNPFLLSGRDANGNAVCLQIMVFDGLVITVSVVASANSFDDETINAYYALFENVTAMIAGENAAELRKSASFANGWQNRVSAVIQAALHPSGTPLPIQAGGQNQAQTPETTKPEDNQAQVSAATTAAPAGNGSAGSGGPVLIGQTQGSTTTAAPAGNNSAGGSGPVLIYSTTSGGTSGGSNGPSSSGGTGSWFDSSYDLSGGYGNGYDDYDNDFCAIPWYQDDYSYYDYWDDGDDDYDSWEYYGYCYPYGGRW